jgi:hypothetical protein
MGKKLDYHNGVRTYHRVLSLTLFPLGFVTRYTITVKKIIPAYWEEGYHIKNHRTRFLSKCT